MKKTVIFILAMLLVLSSLTPLQTSAADDLTGYLYEKEMRELIELGVLNGYPDGTYQPKRKVTRAEFAKMVVKSFELESQVQSAEFTSAAATEMTFTDVPMDKWYAVPILDAVKAGIVNGYPNNTFKPDALITREQMASMVARAMKAKGIVTDMKGVPQLAFTDTTAIHNDHKEDVRILTHLGIIKGNENNTFAPKGESERWMVALLMLRGREIVFPPVPKEFQASSIKDGATVIVKEFDTFAEAQKFVAGSSTAHVVERSSQIMWMKGEGLAVANKFTEVFPTETLKTDWNTKYRPYVTANAEMKFLGATDKYVKVELAGKVGYVPANTVNLLPKQLLTGQSYYQMTTNGELIHYIYNHNTKAYATAGVIGVAPEAFQAGAKYYSWDGANFTDAAGKKVTESHQYFNKLQLATKTNYTAEELDRYLEEAFPYYNKKVHGKVWTESPLVGTGEFFKAVEKEYKVNAFYLLAHALHESQWGTSLIAQDKKNLFGLNAVDGDAYNGAKIYADYKESIVHAAQHVNGSYQKVTGTNYNGSFLGNKGMGMNVRYASDHLWGEKIAGHMYRADKFLGNKDLYAYNLGITTISGLNFRNAAGATGTDTVLYKTPLAGIPVVILGETTVSGAKWYNVVSEDKAYTDAFGYGSGSLGTYIKLLPLAK
ncbi:S-layer homology domain-containing protein [Planomicrobium sp. MB-3u-38]|uniref:S-layer homology domain-containing protein n=1 Tax=Planomicrobium sp. MB-3u-38 TaxID=2058318 RepID=UPI000C7E0333|nr:S-layer homology domain-containing protein [Planomicrobium sp. MB-3u-38]PKH09075.1 S-layer protein [Planomicrobium sp. MB-3u-38]